MKKIKKYKLALKCVIFENEKMCSIFAGGLLKTTYEFGVKLKSLSEELPFWILPFPHKCNTIFPYPGAYYERVIVVKVLNPGRKKHTFSDTLFSKKTKSEIKKLAKMYSYSNGRRLVSEEVTPLETFKEGCLGEITEEDRKLKQTLKKKYGLDWV